MRVIKEADQRKNEILDVAETLFTLKGFDKTSTNEILEAVGIAVEHCITILNQKRTSWML